MSNTAIRDMKSVGSDIVREENKLEALKSEVQKLSMARDAIQAEIDRKSSDFNIYMSQKDAETKKSRADMLLEKEQLMKDQSDFQDILKQHKGSQSSLEEQKRLFEIEKLRFVSTTSNVQEFITTVRRAYGLLGI